MPSRQIAAAIAGCRTRGAERWSAFENFERALVADLAEREHRVLLQRSVELRDLDERSDARTST